jgi:hypothetical protein
MDIRICFRFLLIGFLLAACSNSTTPNGSTETILLNNSTFDSSGNPALYGWTYGQSDMDSIPRFERYAPPGSSATWSVALSPGWVPTTTNVYRDFTGLSSGVYKLSLWAKIFHGTGAGSFLIEQSDSSHWKIIDGAPVMDSIWYEFTLLDTLTLRSSDTVRINLTGGTTEVANWEVLYNNISFAKLLK